MPAHPQTQPRPAADIVILVDVSSGMRDCFAILKEKLLAFVDALLVEPGPAKSPVIHWRAKVVGCADFTADSEPFEDRPFVEDVEALRHQVHSLRCRTETPGDYSSLPDALHRLVTVPMMEANPPTYDPNLWRSRREAGHLVFAFTALPCRATLTDPADKPIGGVVDLIHERQLLFGLFAPGMSCYYPLYEADLAEYFTLSSATSALITLEQQLIEAISDPTLLRLATDLFHSGGWRRLRVNRGWEVL